MIKTFKIFLTLSLLLTFGFHPEARSQTIYPVQVNTQLIPPYTPFTPNYYSGMKEKLKVTLINTDLKQPMLNVYLLMKITSSKFSLINPQEIVTPVVQLPAGIPVTLSLQDLAPYFRHENLRISGGQAEFLRTLSLPDNFYRFHFEVFEMNTRRLLSNPNTGFAQAMIAAGEPPVLNFPEKGKIITESSIPNIFFSWTPRHFNSVAAAYGTEYEITLVEIFDKTVAPQSAFLYGRVVYSEITRATSFIHTAAQPLLIPGMRYAWRVRAIAKDGLEDANVFRNEGYSEVFYFDYAADCETVGLSTVLIEKTTARITWMPIKASEYLLQYRKKGSAKWRDTPVVFNATEYPLAGLEYGQTYEYRIGTRCVANDSFDFCEHKAFTMPAQPERNPECGMLPEADLSNQKPLEKLMPGLPVFAGDFPVFVNSVSGANGRFSGTGYVGLPFTGVKVAVVFDNIFINSDYKLVEGIIEVKYDPNGKSMMVDIDQTLTGGKGVGDIRSGEEKAKFSVGYNINPNAPIEIKPTTWKNVPDDIKNTLGYTPAGGENAPAYIITFEDEEGKKHDIVVDSLPATVEDKDGDIFVVSEDGKLTEAVTASDLKLDPTEKDKPDSSIATIVFETTPKTKYALDIYRDIYAKVPEYFLKYKPSGEDMIASAKFIAVGQSDEIFVRVTDTKTDFDPKKVHFITGNDKEYKGIYDDGKKGWTINLIGGQAGDGQEIYVVYEKEKGKPVTLSKIRTYAYEPKSIRIKLIPVNGFTNGFTKESVSAQLNAIYNKVAVNCNVEIANSFDYEPLKDKTFDVTGSGLFSTLTTDMKSLNNAYKQAHPEETDICLFIIENVTGAEGIAGDMPRGKQFGYLFPGADVRTIAHEIGHGIFQLEHPFERALRGQFEKGQLEHCLMDYGSGTEFCKLEWDAINAPGLVIGLFEKDEDAMSEVTSNEKLYACLEEIRQSIRTGSEVKTRNYPILSKNEIRVSGKVYSFITIKRMNTRETSFSLKDAQPELFIEYNIYGVEQYCIGFLNKRLTIVLKTPKDRENLLDYFYEKRSNTYLLFVSGYDFVDEAIDFINKNDSKTKTETWWDGAVGFVNKTPVSSDDKEYWGSEFVDNFVSLLRPKNVTYMSGYENVGTSNHKTIGDFVRSMVSSYTARYTFGLTCYLNPECVRLNTQPNTNGFNQRRSNGKQRGIDFVNMLKTKCVKGEDGLVHDTVDIVCHSMGFAHSLGIVDVLREAMKTDLKGLKFGRFYIIAPENAGSGEVNENEWQEVWQYGSDEKNTPLWLQDGVAPQCPIRNMETRRAYIPEKGVPRGFLESHKIENYGWIFNKTENENGYITPRK